MPAISFIVPTEGVRLSLGDAINTIRPLHAGDEILIVCDKCGHWGMEGRVEYMKRAKNDWMMFIDDDDAFLPGALDKVRAVLDVAPKYMHIFKMDHLGKIIWERPEIFCGNVSTQMIAVPTHGPLGEWGTRYQGDFDFIKSTQLAYGGKVIWRTEVIAKWGGTRNESEGSGK